MFREATKSKNWTSRWIVSTVLQDLSKLSFKLETPKFEVLDASLFRLQQLGEQILGHCFDAAKMTAISTSIDSVLSLHLPNISAATLVRGLNGSRKSSNKYQHQTKRNQIPAAADLIVVCRHFISHRQDDIVLQWLTIPVVSALAELDFKSITTLVSDQSFGLEFAPSNAARERNQWWHPKPASPYLRIVSPMVMVK